MWMKIIKRGWWKDDDDDDGDGVKGSRRNKFTEWFHWDLTWSIWGPDTRCMSSYLCSSVNVGVIFLRKTRDILVITSDILKINHRRKWYDCCFLSNFFVAWVSDVSAILVTSLKHKKCKKDWKSRAREHIENTTYHPPDVNSDEGAVAQNTWVEAPWETDFVNGAIKYLCVCELVNSYPSNTTKIITNITSVCRRILRNT